MNTPLDASVLALLVLLSWQLARAIVFVGATMVCLLSRRAARRAEARRILRILVRQHNEPEV